MKVRDLIDKIKDLPTLPKVAAEINAETQKESLTAKSLAVLIVQDASLTAKVLKLANSAFYGLVRQVDTIDRAVTVLGLQTIKNLALTVSIQKFFTKDATSFIDMDGLWHHSLACGVAARCLVTNVDPKLAENAFISGIVHDIGKNILANYLTNEMTMVIGRMKESKMPQSEVEKEVIGFSHARVGAVLAEAWNFPNEYVKAIRLHHNPTLDNHENLDETRLITAVHIGNKIAKIKKLGQSTDQTTDHIDLGSWRILNFSKDMVPALLQKVEEDFNKIMQSWDD